MFNLSLSSKELFHSNFIAFLINNDNKILDYMFDDFIDINWTDKITVERERDNFDLLVYDNENCLIIENKVKSLPNIIQLIEYQKKAEGSFKYSNKKFILLTIYEPSNLIFEETGDWIVLNYVDLLKRLKKYSDDIKSGYLKEVVLDYIGFMDNFIKLFKTLEITGEQSIFIDDDILKDLKELRIHDLFYKSRFEVLKADLRKHIDDKYGNKYKVIESNKWHLLDYGEIAVDNGFTRGTGLFEFKFPIHISKNNHKYVIGVQLQEHSFKILIQSTDKKSIGLIAEQFNNNKLWFDFSILNEVCTTTNKQKIEYCSYNGKEGLMLYKYQTIKDVSKAKIIDIFMNYLKQIIYNKDRFVDAFLKFEAL